MKWKWLLFWAPTIIALVVVLVYRHQFGVDLSNSRGDFGQFGDYFGGVMNPIVALLALWLLVENLGFTKKAQEALETQNEATENRARINDIKLAIEILTEELDELLENRHPSDSRKPTEYNPVGPKGFDTVPLPSDPVGQKQGHFGPEKLEGNLRAGPNLEIEFPIRFWANFDRVVRQLSYAISAYDNYTPESGWLMGGGAYYTHYVRQRFRLEIGMALEKGWLFVQDKKRKQKYEEIWTSPDDRMLSDVGHF